MIIFFVLQQNIKGEREDNLSNPGNTKGSYLVVSTTCVMKIAFI